MSNLYCKIHRLKSQGWTWDHFLSEIELLSSGIDEKTLKSPYKSPHRKASQNVSKIIDTLHEKHFPSPFPEEIEALMRIYNNIRICYKHPTIDSDTQDLLTFLHAELGVNQGNSKLRLSRLHWLIANIFFDQIPLLRDNRKISKLATVKQEAINHYQLSLSLINSHNTALRKPYVSEFEQYKLEQNILACHLNAELPEQRYNSPIVISHLQTSSFLDASEKVLSKEAYQWVVARNGLRFSSLIKDAQQCHKFFSHLVTANKLFSDIGYSPDSYPPINESPEFTWAIENAI